MNDKKVVPFQRRGPFTGEANKRWNIIPKWDQQKILENVWCVECRVAVSIILETAEMQSDDLLLRGKCKTCGHEVCRLVEPEAV
ncbi:MAG: hypothetical protein ACYC29_07765 [Thermoleophilia bacterium]